MALREERIWFGEAALRVQAAPETEFPLTLGRAVAAEQAFETVLVKSRDILQVQACTMIEKAVRTALSDRKRYNPAASMNGGATNIRVCATSKGKDALA